MPDHLDYIRIRGLEDADTEVFQGVGASAADTTTTPITAPAEDTTRIAEALEKGLLTSTEEDGEGVLAKSFLYTDNDVLTSIFDKAFLTTSAEDGYIQSIFAKEAIPESIKSWMTSCETFLAGSVITTWVDSCWATDAANVAAKDAAIAADPPLPVPLPTPMPPIPLLPTLPVLPPTGPTGLLWQVFMYFLKRYILKLVQEFLRKLIGKIPGWIDRPPTFDGIVQALKDLNFNNLEFALPGGGRIHISGLWIKK